ncbi:MAG: 4-hydroxybenzoate octaprenyltransferase [Rickettsiales bacterium]|nr:4-hydroxybenzoate octaprenyltransferase [Rickettsiales bacterium]
MKYLFVVLDTIRFFNPHGTLLLFLPCLIAIEFMEINYSVSIKDYVVFFFGAFLVRSIACVINDLLDRKFDSKVARTKTRPIVSGRISVLGALLIIITLSILALICLLQLNSKAIVAGLFAPFLFASYPLFKRFTYLPQLFLGFCMSYGVVIVGLHFEHYLSFNVFILFLSMVCWTFGYDTIYAYQDIIDDKKVGVKSSALLFGHEGKKYILLSYIMFLFLTLFVSTRYELGFLFFVLLNVLGFYILARIQFLDLYDIEACKVEFKQNVYYGFLLYLLILLVKL